MARLQRAFCSDRLVLETSHQNIEQMRNFNFVFRCPNEILGVSRGQELKRQCDLAAMSEASGLNTRSVTLRAQNNSVFASLRRVKRIAPREAKAEASPLAQRLTVKVPIAREVEGRTKALTY